MKKFYSTYEIAKICDVSPGSVIRWIREGKLTASLTAGGHHRVRDRYLVELLQSLKIPVPDELKPIERLLSQVSILIVDDDDAFRKLIVHFLEEAFLDVRIEEASEGFIAGWKVRGICPDVVILDLMMPDLDGFQVCELIRSIPELDHTKIIAITGYGEEKKEAVMALGADDFLAKPFEKEELKAKVVKLLNGKADRAKAEGV